MKKSSSYRTWIPLVSALALVAAFLIGAVVIALNGDSPADAYWNLLKGSFGSTRSVAGTLSSATPLIFTGLGVAVAMKSGMANIGAEGQLYMGAIAAAVVAIYAPLPGVLLIPASLAAAFLAGGFWGWIPAALKVRCSTDEVVTTLMLNYIAKLFTAYLANYPLKAKGSPLGQTVEIPAAAKLPVLIKGTRFNVGFIVAVAFCVFIAILFKYMPMGYEMRIAGENREFARFSGVDVKKRLTQGMFLGGGLAGLGGAVLVLGIQYKFVQGISPGYGFDGLTIALMAAFNSIAVLPVAVLFGALRSGGITMELLTNVPSELSEVIQAIVILFMAAQTSFTKKFQELVIRRQSKKEARG